MTTANADTLPDDVKREFAAGLLDWLQDVPEHNHDWALALLHAAIDEFNGDPLLALRKAQEHYQGMPEPPDEVEGDYGAEDDGPAANEAPTRNVWGEKARKASEAAYSATEAAVGKTIKVESNGAGGFAAKALRDSWDTGHAPPLIADVVELAHDTPAGVVHDALEDRGDNDRLHVLHDELAYHHAKASRKHELAALKHREAASRAANSDREALHDKANELHLAARTLHAKESEEHNALARQYNRDERGRFTGNASGDIDDATLDAITAAVANELGLNYDPSQTRDNSGKWTLGGIMGAVGGMVGGAMKAAGMAGDPRELQPTGLPGGKDLASAPRKGGDFGGSKPNFTVNVGGRQYFVKQAGSAGGKANAGKNEVVASEVARLAGLEHPPVRQVVIGGKDHVVSPLVDAKSLDTHQIEGTLREAVGRIPKADIARAVVADYAMGFSDTQSGNYMVGKGGGLIHIDKETSFNVNPLAKGYTPSEKHVMLRVALGHPVQTGVAKVGGDNQQHIAERKAYPLDKSVVQDVASRTGAMAQRLRQHGMNDAAAHLEHRGEVLRQLAAHPNPTVGDLEHLHASHGRASY